MIASSRLAGVFSDVADTLVDDFDVIEFLELVTRHTAEVSQAASAGLLLADPHGQLQYMASSAESVRLLELFQLQYQEVRAWTASARPRQYPTPTSAMLASGGRTSRPEPWLRASSRCMPFRCATAAAS